MFYQQKVVRYMSFNSLHHDKPVQLTSLLSELTSMFRGIVDQRLERRIVSRLSTDKRLKLFVCRVQSRQLTFNVLEQARQQGTKEQSTCDATC